MNKNGSILIPVLVYSMILITIGSSLIAHSARNIFSVKYHYQKALALQAAEAGAEKAIWSLNEGYDLTFLSNEVIAEIPSEYEVIIEQSLNKRTIISTGYSPSKENYKEKKRIKVFLKAGGMSQGLAFNYAVQVGDWGLNLNNNAIINGSVYSNGNIVGSRGSRINGDAYAFSTISSPPTIIGSKNQNQPKIAMPTLDFESWKYFANINENPNNGNLIISGTQNLGPRKIVGNLTVNVGSVLNLTGPLHITGNLILNSNAKITLDTSFGDNGTVIIAEGRIIIGNNTAITRQGEHSFIILASEYSSSTEPAIIVRNNADIGAESAGGVYYALNGIIEVNNNAHPVSLIGKRLVLRNNAIVNYDSGLASTIFSSGPGGGWRIVGWQLIR